MYKWPIFRILGYGEINCVIIWNLIESSHHDVECILGLGSSIESLRMLVIMLKMWTWRGECQLHLTLSYYISLGPIINIACTNLSVSWTDIIEKWTKLKSKQKR